MKILLIDGNSIMFRAYYATYAVNPSNMMHTKSGFYTNAIFGFIGMIQKLIETNDATHMLVAFDTDKKTFRHEEFEEYKGTRKTIDDELLMQIPAVKEYLDCMNILRLELAGYEADDIIGTFAKKASDAGADVRVISGDRDMLQLVDKNVSVFLTKRGVSEIDEYRIDNFFEKSSMYPHQVIDYKGLTGDSSDNLPGIKGVGPKTAIKLLNDFGSLENIINSLDKIQGKLKENIEKDQDLAKKSKKLATIYTSVPFDFGLDHLKVKAIDYSSLRKYFEKYELRSMLRKLDESYGGFIVGDQEKANEGLKINAKFHSLQAIVKHLNQDAIIEIELDRENYHRANVLGLSFLLDEDAYFLEKTELYDERIIEYLENPQYKKQTIDSKRLIVALAKMGIDIKGIDFDLNLAIYCVNPNYVSENLRSMIEYFASSDILNHEDIYGKKTLYQIPDLYTFGQYSLNKCLEIKKIKEIVWNRLIKTNQLDLFIDIELPLAVVLAKIELAGFQIDKIRLSELGQKYNEKITSLRKEIYALTNEEFNIDSPKQLGVVLFEKLGLTTGRKTKTGYSTAADVLENLALNHEVPRLVIEYRKYVKLFNTYVTGLINEIHPEDGKVHTIFKQALTLTGRLSSTEPNIQNIPIRTEEGRDIRSAFVPNFDYLLSADYSQIELRILASMSQSKHMIDDFNQGLDLHASTASKIYEVPLSEVTKEMRRYAKAVNFGIIYGMSDWGLAETLHIEPYEAASFINKYFSIYPQIKIFLDDIVTIAKKNGYSTTLFNRRRYIPELKSSNHALRKFGERTAMNAPLQGSAADIIKIAMIKINQAIEGRNLKSKMIAQVHDELVFDVDQNELAEMMALVKETMENAVDIGVNLTVDLSHGKTWKL